MSALRTLIATPWRLAWSVSRLLVPEPAGAFRILLFHDVPPARRAAFAALAAGLHGAGRLIGPAEAERRLRGEGEMVRGGPAPVLITFDDGFASNAEVARDILDPLGIQALFFVCPGLVDMPAGRRRDAIAANIFQGRVTAGDLPSELDLMGWDAIAALAAAGHTIGSHTLSHRRLAGLGPAERAEEVGGAARLLESRLGRCGDWFAYTFGDVDSIDPPGLAEIRRHHRWCRSGVRGLNGAATPPLTLRGDNVDLEASEAWRRMVLAGGLDPFYRRARLALDAKVTA